MTPDKLKELRKIAEAATAGPWRVNPHIDRDVWTSDLKHRIAELNQKADHSFGRTSVSLNSEFIAAFNPKTALELLDQLAEANEHIKELERLHHANLCRWEEKDREFVVAREKQLNEKLEKSESLLEASIASSISIREYAAELEAKLAKARDALKVGLQCAIWQIEGPYGNSPDVNSVEIIRTCLKEISDEGAG